MNRRVVITGLGVISSIGIGIGWQEFWDNLLKGKSGISPVRSFDTTNHFTHNGGEVKNFNPEECAAIKKVFGSGYKKIPVSSIKSMLGHTMGAASALEAIACALVIKNNIIPPTINYETPDPECDIDCVPNQARKHVVDIALNNSYAFGGNNACLVIKKFMEGGI